MSNIDNTILELKKKIQQAQLAKIRAETVRENAEAAEKEALQRLYDEFGLDNLNDARAKLGELQAQLQAHLDEITSTLDKMGF